MDEFQHALYYSAEKHNGQYRKGSKIPYIVHPVMVAHIVSKYTGNINTIVAALLHDVVEDCDVSINDLKKEFGDDVSTLVNEVSLITLKNETKQTWQEKKSVYLEKIKTISDQGLIIIAADKIINMSSYFEAVEKNVADVQKYFSGTVDDYVWYYTEIKKILDKNLNNHQITRRYSEILNLSVSKIPS